MLTTAEWTPDYAASVDRQTWQPKEHVRHAITDDLLSSQSKEGVVSKTHFADDAVNPATVGSIANNTTNSNELDDRQHVSHVDKIRSQRTGQSHSVSAKSIT